MELRHNPDDIAAADVGNITIFSRRRRPGIRPTNHRGKAEEACCYDQSQERPSVPAAVTEKSLNPSTLMLHCPHLIISHVTRSCRQPELALRLLALPFLVRLFFFCAWFLPCSAFCPVRFSPAVLPAIRPALQDGRSFFRFYS